MQRPTRTSVEGNAGSQGELIVTSVIDRPGEDLRRDIAGPPGRSQDRSSLVERMRAMLSAGSKEIQARFDVTEDADFVHHERSRQLDAVLQGGLDFADDHLFQQSNLTKGEALAVVALGGYGRGEIAPGSDIDLLFLYPYKSTPRTEQTAEFLLYRLWDLNLKVGQSVRSIKDCIKLARTDLQIETSLLEARLIWGSNEVFGEFQERFRKEVIEQRGPEFIEQKLAERDERHQRVGDTRYVLEPNIKEGKGGLRDLHTLVWIGRYLYDIKNFDDLVEHDVLASQAAHTFERARRFLWTVRCHLHYITGRAEERLTFDLQPEIARRMGYRDRGRVTGVERFMKYYYFVAKEVGDLTRIVCAALEERHQRRPTITLPRFGFGLRRHGGFLIQRGRIGVEDEDLFSRSPIKVLEFFSLAQSRNLDLHPEALRLISECRSTVFRDLWRDPEANSLFLAMLTSPNDPATTLKRMNEAGVLGRFVPDFGRIVAQMQYNLYHVYTVDEHTIRAIGNLYRIETGDLEETMPLAVELMPQISSRQELYVAIFLHDLGKGRNRNHSIVGEEIALSFCERLGLSESKTETVAWLVRNHLVMSNFAFKRDSDDPQAITDFVKIVQSPERLRLLTILTMADIYAVGPGVWNGWKGQLLRSLYHETRLAMSSGDMGGPRARRLAGTKERLTELLIEHKIFAEDDAEQFVDRHDEHYLLAFSPDDLIRHAKMMRQAEREELPLVFDFRVDEDQDRTELTVYTADHPGLFMKIAGALAISGVTVVEARIFTTSDWMALDVFSFQDPSGNAVELEKRRTDRIQDNLEKALRGEIRLERAFDGKGALPSRADVFRVEPRVIIDNKASRTHTLVEVNGRDRPGLLFALAATFKDMRLIITSAHINTFGERVVDVFYIKDVFGLKITQRSHQNRIEAALLKALASD